jgi:malate dehydrogenase (oxaloacetate-decarboxylating)
MSKDAAALKLHEKLRGKIISRSKIPLRSLDDLSLLYTPGVAAVSRAIAQNKNDVYKYTMKGNTVGIVSDGSAVLGLGNIGPEAALPVMEGKALLFSALANIDAFPVCLSTQKPNEIIKAVIDIAPVFGGINLEDIAAPQCFDIETKLKKKLDIPVMHDDQHGTAVVVLAGMMNAMKVAKKTKSMKVVMAGAGAAGTATAKMLLNYGIDNIILVDRQGAIYKGRKGLNIEKKKLALLTNKDREQGSLEDVLKGADCFVGVSSSGLLKPHMVKTMQAPIIFAMANPVPEIFPQDAMRAGARIVATGRSDFPNQINNVLGFPGIFRGALDIHARDINEPMKLAAAEALARLVKPSPKSIIPAPLDKRVVPAVARAVMHAAKKSGVA